MAVFKLDYETAGRAMSWLTKNVNSHWEPVIIIEGEEDDLTYFEFINDRQATEFVLRFGTDFY